jgi:chloride channel protein, CIC family
MASGRPNEIARVSGEPGFNRLQGLPIAGKDGRLRGIVTQGDLLRALELDPYGKMTAPESGSGPPIVADPDELAFDALFRMRQNNIGRRLVVSLEDPRVMVGFLNRASLLGAWTSQMEEEGVRGHGWLARFMKSENELKAAEK